MTGTKITLTNDADCPRVLNLGSGVFWYVYRRTTDSGLYLRREAGGVLGPETLVAEPVDEVDAIVDPDGLRAWIYFTCDGALRCIEVTTLTETPTTQFFQRQAGWYERVEGGFGGLGTQGDFGFTDEATAAWRTDDGPVEVYPPTLGIFDPGVTGQRLLIIQRNTVRYGVVAKFRIYKLEAYAGQGWQFYADVALPVGETSTTLMVPKAPGLAVWSWVATAIRTRPYLESAWSNIVTDDSAGDVVIAAFGGVGTDSQWALVDKTPLKYAAPIDSYAPGKLGAQGVDGQWALIDKTPIKYAAPIDSYTPGALGGMGVGGRWALNGTEIIAP